MKITEVVAALSGLTEAQVNTIVEVVNHTREANTALSSLEPKKRRGRKPGVKAAPKAAKPTKAAPAKKAGKKSSKVTEDKFTE